MGLGCLGGQEILDVVLAVTARNFMSKTLDALAAEPNAALCALLLWSDFVSVPRLRLRRRWG
jgi:hypothetical protein